LVYFTGVPMLYRALGKTGLSISEVSLGSWLTYGSRVDAEAAKRCVTTAFELGVNFFDTADVYTGAERALGEALRELPRSEYVVATKCFFPMSESPLERGLSRKHVVDSVNRSLRALGTDYLDVLQCHRFDPETPVEETARALDDLVAQGKILYWGVSRWTAPQLRDVVGTARRAGWRAPVVSQVPYNMLYRDFEAEVLPAARELGLGTVVYSPLAQGVLTGKYKPGHPPPPGTRAAHATAGRLMRKFMTDEVLERVQHLVPIAGELGLSLSQLAIAWVLQNPNVSSAIIGASRRAQVEENVKAAGVKIPAELMQRIDQVLGPVVERDPAKTVSPDKRP
jgi:aryl-alcohol dehydrogenase-like predicted oxidoreductase